MDAMLFEHATRDPLTGNVLADGRTVSIRPEKVCAIMSGGDLAKRSEGGDDTYCIVFLDGGHQIMLCGTGFRVASWLGIAADV